MHKTLKGFMSIALLTMLGGCGGSSGSGSGASTANDVTISGSLSQSFIETRSASRKDVGAYSITLSDLEIYAIAFTNPPTIAKADVSAAGSFSVTMSSAKNAPITALFRNKTDLTTVGQVVFQDPTVKDLNGNTKDLSTVALSGNASLGNITLGTDGKVVIPVSQIAGSNATSTSVDGFDFGGSYTAAAFPNPPTGFRTATTCTNNNDCGMEIGTPITFIRFSGKAFTKNGSCTSDSACPDTAGTISETNKYAISIWEGTASGGQSAISSCGYKTGFTAASARWGGGINLTTLPTVGGSAMTLGDFTFSGGSTENTNNSKADNKPWMKTNATARHDMYACSNISQNGLSISVCEASAKIIPQGTDPSTVTATTVYMAGSQGGGCTEDANGHPVNVTDWMNVRPDTTSNTQACTSTAVSGFTGMYTQSCHYTNQDPDGTGGPMTAKTFSCSFTHGTFNTFNGTAVSSPVAANAWLSNVVNTIHIAANARCDSLTYNKATASDNGKRLATYRCYAENYEGGGSGCIESYNFNWAANNPDNFEVRSGRGKPEANFVTDIATYSGDGNTFFVDNTQTETVAVGGQNGTLNFCDLERGVKLTGQKITDSQILTTVTQQGRLRSLNPTCLAAATDSSGNGNVSDRLGEEKLIFYMNK